MSVQDKESMVVLCGCVSKECKVSSARSAQNEVCAGAVTEILGKAGFD